jgi:transcriptional regulator with XRE-family HTH domain
VQNLSFSGYMQAFAAETRRARKERGFSREELARRARVHENTIGMLERGERDLSCISQTRLLAALGCDGLHIDSDGVSFSLGSPFALPRWFWLLDAQPAAVVELMGASIRERRKALGFSIEALAGKAGIHRNSVWNFEKGLVAPNGYSVFALFRALDMPMARADILHPDRRSKPVLCR